MKQKVMDALRLILMERREAIRQRLLSCMADHVEQELNGLSQPPALDDELFALPSRSEALPPSALLAELQGAMERLAGAGEQVAILEHLIQGATRFAARVVVFVCRDGQAMGWGESGFAANPQSMGIRGVALSLDEDSALSRAASGGTPQTGGRSAAADPIWTAIGANPSARFTALPLAVQGRVVAVVFADGGPEADDEARFEPAALAILARMAEMSLELLALRSARHGERVDRRPSDAWRDRGPGGTAEAAPTTRGDASAPGCRETREPQGHPPPQGEDAPEAASATTPAQARDAAVPVDDTGEDVAQEQGAPDPENDALHEEARRFARLLVSEILLYNPEEVQQGKASRDLYDRLRQDLERSEQVYLRRIAPQVAKRTDYFREEVIRTLADGDPSLLGSTS